MTTLIIVAVVAAIAFFLFRGRLSSDGPSKGAKLTAKKALQTAQKPFGAKEFVADRHACDAAKMMNGGRFLEADAVKLPLADCSDPAFCRCKYGDVTDRRAGDDRRGIVGALSIEMPIGDDRSNRRAGRDRRKDDISFDYDN